MSNLSLQVPPRPICVGGENSGEHLSQNHGHSKASSSTGGSGLGFSCGLTFKNKTVLLDGEGSSLLNLEGAAKPDKIAGHEKALLSNIVARFSWKRCASLPVKRASDMSPSPTSSQGMTHTEHHGSQVGFLVHKGFRQLIY